MDFVMIMLKSTIPLICCLHARYLGKKGMYPSYPSITFPNHYTIATGLYPSHTGIVDNVFYDPHDEKYIIGTPSILDGSWYKGEPLWSLAEKQGMLAASLFWVGSESDAGGMRPLLLWLSRKIFRR
jgi:predicted AlkP superfamily pyrophosphatase or phosphodiesterase